MNIDRAYNFLNWEPKWDFNISVRNTINWYKKFYHDETSALSLCIRDLEDFINHKNVQIINNSVGCDSIITLNLDVISGIKNQLSTKTHIYPNPAKELVYILSEYSISELSLYNTQGRILKVFSVNDNKIMQIESVIGSAINNFDQTVISSFQSSQRYPRFLR